MLTVAPAVCVLTVDPAACVLTVASAVCVLTVGPAVCVLTVAPAVCVLTVDPTVCVDCCTSCLCFDCWSSCLCVDCCTSCLCVDCWSSCVLTVGPAVWVLTVGPAVCVLTVGPVVYVLVVGTTVWANFFLTACVGWWSSFLSSLLVYGPTVCLSFVSQLSVLNVYPAVCVGCCFSCLCWLFIQLSVLVVRLIVCRDCSSRCRLLVQLCVSVVGPVVRVDCSSRCRLLVQLSVSQLLVQLSVLTVRPAVCADCSSTCPCWLFIQLCVLTVRPTVCVDCPRPPEEERIAGPRGGRLVVPASRRRAGPVWHGRRYGQARTRGTRPVSALAPPLLDLSVERVLLSLTPPLCFSQRRTWVTVSQLLNWRAGLKYTGAAEANVLLHTFKNNWRGLAAPHPQQYPWKLIS